MLAQKLPDLLLQQALVENRSGAAGTIAGRFVGHAAPNAYTLLPESLSIAQSASLSREPGFSAANDLLPIAQLVELPFIVPIDRKRRLAMSPGSSRSGSAGRAR